MWLGDFLGNFIVAIYFFYGKQSTPANGSFLGDIHFKARHLRDMDPTARGKSSCFQLHERRKVVFYSVPISYECVLTTVDGRLLSVGPISYSDKDQPQCCLLCPDGKIDEVIVPFHCALK